MNFKVKCVGYVSKTEKYFTVGKVYNVEDGELISDDGFRYDTWGETFEDLQQWFKKWYKFELIEARPEIHITVKGKETIAVYKCDKEYKKAVAKCSPEDTFDFGVGAKLALERLGVLVTERGGKNVKFKTGDYAKIVACTCGHQFEIGTIVKLERREYNYCAYANGKYWFVLDEELEAYPQYYSGKVVCVDNGNDNCFVVGKVYEVKDGKLIDEDGDNRPMLTGDHLVININHKCLATESGSEWLYKLLPLVD
jgi:hypothetical protein